MMNKKPATLINSYEKDEEDLPVSEKDGVA